MGGLLICRIIRYPGTKEYSYLGDMSVKEKLNQMNSFPHSLNIISYSKNPALFLDPMVSVSYVVSEFLVKNEALQLLRIIKEGSVWLQMEHFVVGRLTVASKPSLPMRISTSQGPLGSHSHFVCPFIPNRVIQKLNIGKKKKNAHSVKGILIHSGKWSETPFQINDRQRERIIIILGKKNETVFNLNVTNASAKAFTKGHSLWFQHVNLAKPIIQTDECCKEGHKCVLEWCFFPIILFYLKYNVLFLQVELRQRSGDTITVTRLILPRLFLQTLVLNWSFWLTRNWQSWV